MTRDEIEDVLRELVAGRMGEGVQPATVPLDVPIFQGGIGLDSMSGIELLTEIEEKFDVYVDDEDFDVFDSLEKLIGYVDERLRESAE